MRLLFACLLALGGFSLLWPALSNPVPKKSGNADSSLMLFPLQTALIPAEAEQLTEAFHSRKVFQYDGKWLCFDGYCFTPNGPSYESCTDGDCSTSAHGAVICGCPEKPASQNIGTESALPSTLGTSLITVEEARDIDKYPTPDPIQQANGYLGIGSSCFNTGAPDHSCDDGGCSTSADGVLTCSCHGKSTWHFTQHSLNVGCEGDTASAAPTPQTIATTRPPDPSITQSPNAMICRKHAGPMCVSNADLSRCDNPLCHEHSNDGHPCSCPDGVEDFWSRVGVQISSLEASSISVEATASASSTPTTLVKRTKAPCPNPKVNPNPPFNFICPGDETTTASNVKRTTEPCPSPESSPDPFYPGCIGLGDDNGCDYPPHKA